MVYLQSLNLIHTLVLFLSEWLSVMEKSLSVLILDFCLICKVGVFDSFSDNFDLSGVSHVLG